MSTSGRASPQVPDRFFYAGVLGAFAETPSAAPDAIKLIQCVGRMLYGPAPPFDSSKPTSGLLLRYRR